MFFNHTQIHILYYYDTGNSNTSRVWQSGQSGGVMDEACDVV